MQACIGSVEAPVRWGGGLFQSIHAIFSDAKTGGMDAFRAQHCHKVEGSRHQSMQSQCNQLHLALAGQCGADMPETFTRPWRHSSPPNTMSITEVHLKAVGLAMKATSMGIRRAV